MSCETCKRFSGCRIVSAGAVCRNYREAGPVAVTVSPEQYANRIGGRVEFVVRSEHFVNDGIEETIRWKFPVVKHFDRQTVCGYPNLLPGTTVPLLANGEKMSAEWSRVAVSEEVTEKVDVFAAAQVLY